MEDIVKKLITQYHLAPLDHEGGYFCRVLGDDPSFSLIYYLMSPTSFSALHILDIHEIWTHISGDPIEQIVIDTDKNISITTIGQSGCDNGISHIGPHLWQGTRLTKGGSMGSALCTTTCIPGYRQENFLLATKMHLQHIVFPKDVPLVSEFLAP